MQSARTLVAKARPVATYGLIAISVALYAITAAQSHDLMNNQRGSSLFWDMALVPYLVAQGEWYRVIGSGFLHFGAVHLAFNMFALWVVGRDLERVLGWARFLAVYLVALLGGSAAVMVGSGALTATAGASGALYGVFGAVAVALLRLKQSPTPMLILIAINLVITFSLPGISLWGHLGGLVAGTACAVGILFVPEWLSARTSQQAARLGWLSVAVVAVVCIAVTLGAAVYLRANPPVMAAMLSQSAGF
ncbi:hypothetical protein GCM10011591_08290 [Nocardia camponoti]|uniref:Peptidase S54 rhomboid domain-containing protein n=1 Tax=Nocardia camponoti TaxID=1616106 RepID=A0A917QAD4_9NOCA|nr:hypothetical protein GCM10011591_08290 [Nocardia camponoti]